MNFRYRKIAFVTLTLLLVVGLSVDADQGLSKVEQYQQVGTGNSIFLAGSKKGRLMQAGTVTNQENLQVSPEMVAAVAPQSDPDDIYWDSTMSPGTGFNAVVGAISTLTSTPVAGGNFTSINSVATSRVASWNGTTWSGLSGLNSYIWTLAEYQGTLYAGGQFGFGSGNFGIASWNGSTWSSVGGGTNLVVWTLCVYDNKLIVGGNFSKVGPDSANGIAAWDGSNWSTLGTGVDVRNVIALVEYNGKLIAGGSFTTAGGNTVNRIASWDGSTWSPMGTGMNSDVYALAVHEGNLIAAGNFTSAGGNVANRIASWNGSTWSALGSGLDAEVWALASYGSEVIAGGSFFHAGGNPVNQIASWNGGSWSKMGSGVSMGAQIVWALRVIKDTLFVGGEFTNAGDKLSRNMARWTKPPFVGYVISATAGANGAISPSGPVPVNTGSDQSFSILPNTGYHITDVIVDGSSVGAQSTYTFTNVLAPHTITASFIVDTFTITATAGAHGSISPVGVTSKTYGSSQAYIISPDVGYHVADVVVDGGSVGTPTSYLFSPIAANYTIDATFALTTVLPTFTSAPPTSAIVGQLYSYTAVASGIPAPTYALASSPVPPVGMTIVPVTGLVQWTPSSTGDYSIGIEATNAAGTTTQNYTIHVGCCTGTTGNVNCAGIVDLGDLSSLVSYLTGGGFVLCCVDGANVNGAGIVDLGDLSSLVSYLTGGGYVLPSCP